MKKTSQTPVGETSPQTPPPESPAPANEEAPADSSQTTPPADLETLLADAENRGYLRGRNERISELMREPAVYERQSAAPQPSLPPDWQGDSQPMILNNPRVSIWDR